MIKLFQEHKITPPRLDVSGRVEVMREPIAWYDDNANNPPWIKALVEVRRLTPRKAGATNTSKQSSWLLISTPKRRLPTGNFS